MNEEIENLKRTRRYILDFIKELSVEQLNEIPAGFNNNIIWNLGHLMVAQQGLCYVRAGIPAIIDSKYLAMFKPETKPDVSVSAEDIDQIKILYISSLEAFPSDYDRKIFTNYTAFTTSFGIEMKNIDNVISFLPFHEGVHLGYIMAMKRLLT